MTAQTLQSPEARTTFAGKKVNRNLPSGKKPGKLNVTKAASKPVFGKKK